MDFSLRGMDEQIRNGGNEDDSYLLYAFVLSANANTDEFLRHLIDLFGLIHSTTGDRMLVVAPQIDIGKGPGVKCSAAEVLNVLESGTYYNYLRRESVDVSTWTKPFIRRYIEQSVAIAMKYEILDKLPVVLFTGSLNSPSRDECFILPIKDRSAPEVAELLREVSHQCQVRSKDYYEKKRQLASLQSRIKNARFRDANAEEENEHRKKAQKVISTQNNADHLENEIESAKKKLQRLKDGHGFEFFCPHRQGKFSQDNSLAINRIEQSLKDLASQYQGALDTVATVSHQVVVLSNDRLAEIEAHNIEMKGYLAELRRNEQLLTAEMKSLRPSPNSIIGPLVRIRQIKSLSFAVFKGAKELLPFLKLLKGGK